MKFLSLSFICGGGAKKGEQDDFIRMTTYMSLTGGTRPFSIK
jgi:hypothetical protein